MKKKLFLISLFSCSFFAVVAQTGTIRLSMDSVVNDTGVLYKYSIKKEAKTLYKRESYTIALGDTISYQKGKMNYKAYVFYDEPTGQQYAVIYDFKERKLYETAWFDNAATGDKIVKEKVNFKKKVLSVQKGNAPSIFYSVKLTLK